VYRNQGRYAEAQPLVERALAIWERALGPDHRLVAESLTGLANVYADQRRYAEAEVLYDRAVDILKRVDSDHRRLFEPLVGLASLRKEQGSTAGALALYERALAIKERTHAADHPELAEIRSTVEALRAATAGPDSLEARK
jgi:tetratricopeptide (TPR) repeat protein